MGWKEFAASVISDVLSWPVAFLVVVLLLLSPLRRLIGRLRSFKGWGAEMSLAEDLLTIAAKTDTALEEGTTTGARSSEPDAPGRSLSAHGADGENAGEDGRDAGATPIPSSRYEEMHFYDTEAGAEIDPVGAITLGWSELLHSLVMLDMATRRVGNRLGQEFNLFDELERKDLLEKSMMDSIRGLQKLRNLVAHGQVAPSPAEALSYRRSAKKIAKRADFLAAKYARSRLNDRPD